MSRFSRFFNKIKSLFSKRQQKAIRDTWSATPATPPVAPTAREPVEPVPATRAPPAAAPAKREPVAPVTATAQEKRQIEAAKRIEEIEKEERRLREEREALTPVVAAMQPPIVGEIKKRDGFQYHTWFKAYGTFGGHREMQGGDSPDILREMIEGQDMDIPKAFYSHSKLGQVKFKGIVDREKLIDRLNDASEWKGSDFRDIYPKWEYTYRIIESVGDVPVRMTEYIAGDRPNKKQNRHGV